MSHHIHSNARTTPAIRLEMQNSSLGVVSLARKYNVTNVTASKWKHRDTVEDKSHRPHKLQTTLSPAEEEVVVQLRTSLLLPLDDLVVVTKRFINSNASRSGISRCLVRHKISRLRDLMPQDEAGDKKIKTFKDYEPGFFHVDIKYLPKMPDQKSRSYLFVGIDRATRWVYLEVLSDKSAKSAQGFLKRLITASPCHIVKLLTDNGKEFTDKYCATGKRKPTGNHVFDKMCAEHDIEHRLTKPRTPQTNGMVERFNGRISDVLGQTRFKSIAELEDTMNKYAKVYNHHIPQKALEHAAPIDAMKSWQQSHPDLFKKKVYKQAGLDK